MILTAGTSGTCIVYVTMQTASAYSFSSIYLPHYLSDAVDGLDGFMPRDVFVWPPFGWYNIFRPALRDALPILTSRIERPRRSQARACRADARRWKRRRFVQALRRMA